MENSFNFSKEMVYGKKHLNKLEFDTKKYDLTKEVTDIFSVELNKLHTQSGKIYKILGPNMLGKDTDTEFHNKFYDKTRQGWPSFTTKYNTFIEEVILPYLGLKEALVQKLPNLRIQLPENIVVCVNHYDSDPLHNHPPKEINFIYALTDMYDTNTLYVETMPRLEEYEPILLKAGNCICFNGNKCKHYNKINKTGKTRVSFDFRVLPLKYYNKLHPTKSITTKQKFIKGGYYKHFNSRLPNEKIPRDIWDKEKHKFNHVMVKYNVKDAWDIVSLFEKKLAEYAGSTYGISVDNCTDALFLCLKYLKYKGEDNHSSKNILLRTLHNN